MRTTINIDSVVLEDLKRLRAEGNKPLGELVSELLAEAIARRASGVRSEASTLSWQSQPMGARVDLQDKEALYAALETEEG